MDLSTRESCPVNVTAFSYTANGKWIYEIPMFSIKAYAETPAEAKTQAVRIFNEKNTEAVAKLNDKSLEREDRPRRKA